MNKERQKLPGEHFHVMETVCPNMFWIAFGEICPERRQIGTERIGDRTK